MVDIAKPVIKLGAEQLRAPAWEESLTDRDEGRGESAEVSHKRGQWDGFGWVHRSLSEWHYS